MRLQQHEINSIISIANTIFGDGSKVILFGSRVHDELKGDQKIDVILAKDSSRLIEREALKKGILLK